jgi:hypothetical protein
MPPRSSDAVAKTPESMANALSRADAEIADRFAALALDIGDVKRRVSEIVQALLASTDEWMSEKHNGPSNRPDMVRLRGLCDDLARAASALEPPPASAERATSRRQRASGEPPPPRSGRDYDYFADLRQLVETLETGRDVQSDVAEDE